MKRMKNTGKKSTSGQPLTSSSSDTTTGGNVIHKFPITVSYSLGATINIGNYESVRVQCGLSIPVYDSKKFKTVKQKATEIVEEWLNEEVERQIEKHRSNGKEIGEIVFEETIDG